MGDFRGTAVATAMQRFDDLATVHGATKSYRLTATEVGVSWYTIFKAVKVRKSSPEQFDRLLLGQVNVSQAFEALPETPDRRAKKSKGLSVPLDLSRPRNQQIVSRAFERFENAVARIEGTCDQLDGKNLEVSRHAITPLQAAQLHSSLNVSVKKMRQVMASLKAVEREQQ